MPYHLSIEEHPGYVHARASGEMSAENALRFLVEANAACRQRGGRSLLLEFGFSGPSLDGGAIYEIITARSAHATAFERIAYVDASTERDKAHMQFAETIARNRGVNVRLFRGVEEARQWLHSPTEGQEQPLRNAAG